MTLPDTNDDERALWAVILTNLGGTPSPNDDERALIFAIASLLISA